MEADLASTGNGARKMPSAESAELKRRKLPKPFADLEGKWNGTGRYKCSEVAGTLFITWRAEGGQTHEEPFLDLCNKPELSEHRKELGNIVAGIVQQDLSKRCARLRK